MNDTIADVLKHTNWEMLRDQKLSLIKVISRLEEHKSEHFDDLMGILHWIDALQDAACYEGYPVDSLIEDENEND